ncbi:MAG: hypothetical protein ACYC6Y_10745 [Thermoguttaceae bacterium]
MAIRSTALQSALAGMTAAHQQLAAAAQTLAKPLVASSAASTPSDGRSPPPVAAAASASSEIGGSLLELGESLTAARLSSATARTARGMLEELLEIGRR